MSATDRSGSRAAYFFLAGGVLVLDQLSKLLAHHYLPGRGAVEVVPGWFSLWYSRNPGGLFGYFREMGDPWRTILLTMLPLVAVGLIAWFLLRGQEHDRATNLGLGMILGGATGNLIDRLFRGEVIDFLDVYVAPGGLADRLEGWFGTAHWPTFNLADSGIVVGASLLLVSIWRAAPEPSPGSDTHPAATRH